MADPPFLAFASLGCEIKESVLMGIDVSRENLRINRFGFAEYEDMIELSREVDVAELAGVLSSIVELVLSEESDLLDSLTVEAQANFVVPLGMCAKMLRGGTGGS